VKQGNSKYNYIEVMACPSGCLNGGGQLKPDSMPQAATVTTSDGGSGMDVTATTVTRVMTARELLAAVESSFATDQIIRPVIASESDLSFIDQLYVELQCSPGDATSRRLFHTQYHAMEKAETKNPLAIQW
jgi:hypothetical protein